jgi:ubiquitin-conjugating enzyme E2 M
MLNILSLKKKQQETKKKTTASQLRIQKDLTELELPKTMKLSLDPMELVIAPDDGLYRGGRFTFSITVPSEYPHEPPKVMLKERVYHPNIDTQGNVCLNILRQDWKPVLNLGSVFVGLMYLFLEPNPDDPLNKEAAETMRSDLALFKRNVTSSMKGGVVDGMTFDCVLK